MFSLISEKIVPRLLTENHKQVRSEIAGSFLDRFQRERVAFLQRITSLHPRVKNASKEWRNKIEDCPMKTISAGKVLATIFLTLEEFYWSIFYINVQWMRPTYASCYDRWKAPIKTKDGIYLLQTSLLHDNARPHTAASTRDTLEEMAWETLKHSPCPCPITGMIWKQWRSRGARAQLAYNSSSNFLWPFLNLSKRLQKYIDHAGDYIISYTKYFLQLRRISIYGV